MYRGEIWWANLPQPMMSEPGYRRPILIVSDDGFNRSDIKTIIAVIINRSIYLYNKSINSLTVNSQSRKILANNPLPIVSFP
jgi:mRNA-degrading endonuclease toxin of MazEF toxin-antitoxin module